MIKMAGRVCCTVCEELYSYDRLPRNLSCGHTYCSTCLDHLLPWDARCPECRTFIRADTVHDLPVSYMLLRLCFSASTGAQTTLQTQDDGKELHSSSQTDAGPCSVHGSLLVLRCQTCDKWLCPDCQNDGEHLEAPRGRCRLQTIPQAAQEARKTQDDISRTVLLKLSKLEGKLASGKSHLENDWRKHEEKLAHLRTQIVEEKKSIDIIKKKIHVMEKFRKNMETLNSVVKGEENVTSLSGETISPQDTMVTIQTTCDVYKSVMITAEDMEEQLQPLLPGPQVTKMPVIDPGRTSLQAPSQLRIPSRPTLADFISSQRSGVQRQTSQSGSNSSPQPPDCYLQ